MRLLLLSLLMAVGAHAHSIGYRSNLLAYSPARGEFPVRSELAQGYVRYLDGTGAERLVAFNYPEPLYGVRSEQPQTLLRSSISINKEEQQQQLALFRAWCEQRYNALRSELERLRAEGKQPTANMLAQYEPLEQLIKTNAFEPVPGLSPELQRARDEHLRIWNEARLQVLRAEAAVPADAIALRTTFEQPIAKTQPLPLPQQVKQIYSPAEPQSYTPLEAPKPVQETAEVLRAREEHLKRYNDALQQQTQQTQPAQVQPQTQQYLIKNIPYQPTDSQQVPQPVQETAEVLRTRAEHLKLYNEALQQQQQQQQQQTLQQLQPGQVQSPLIKNIPNGPIEPQQTPQPVEETAEVKRAREEHLRQYNEAILQQQSVAQSGIKSSTYSTQSIKAHEKQIQLLGQSKLMAEDKVADIGDKIRYEERDRDAEIQQEQERREELRLVELERQREEQRLIEEQRRLDAERIALKEEEQLRIENERREEAQRLQEEQLELQQQLKTANAEQTSDSSSSSSSSYKLIGQAPAPAQPQFQLAQPQSIGQQQQVQNGFFLRIQSGQPSQPIQTIQPSQPISEGSYLLQNPFLVRYIQQPQQALVKTQTQLPIAAASAAFTASTSATAYTGSTGSTGSTSAASTKTSTSLSELEQATREHFKAHEMALEQLRVANLKNPNLVPCTH